MENKVAIELSPPAKNNKAKKRKTKWKFFIIAILKYGENTIISPGPWVTV